jgi:hypothetical protein
MRGRLILITLINSTLMLTGCRLSDQQQVGVLRFVANSITGAIDDGAALTVAPANKAAVTPAVTRPEQHVNVHALSHLQRCRVRVRTIPARMIISANVQALRQFFAGYTVTVAKKTCPRSAPTIRS